MSPDRNSPAATGSEALAEANRLQRQGADPAGSAWVSASAGSGKTKLLADRVLRLLLADVPPDKILCLTYTRAAAAEMSNRIAECLGKWASCDSAALDREFDALLGRQPAPPVRRLARQLFARVLDVPGGLKIMTIHAFCQSLLRRFPLEAGVAPQFQLIEERDAAQLLDEAMRAVLAQAASDPGSPIGRAVAAVTARIGEGEFGDLMRQLRMNQTRLRRHLAREGGVAGALGQLRIRLGLGADDTLDAVLGAACNPGTFDEALLRRAAQALLAGSTSDNDAGERMAAWLAADAATRLATFDSYALAFLTKKGSVRKSLATKAAQKLLPDILSAMAVEAKRIEAVLAKCASLRLVDATESLLVLGEAVLDRYARRKRVRAALDYDDLIERANALLGDAGSAWVHYKLDGGIDHVLVDEAQDTSPDQWRIVEALTDEFFAGSGADRGGQARTVFAVGDRKQSIFSFQGADPDSFEAMRRRFAARIAEADGNLTIVPLDVSFRSVECVLNAVDNVFADAATARGVVEADSEPLQHRATRVGQAGTVELWPLVEPRGIGEPDAWAPPVERFADDSPRERLARGVARHIAHLIRTGERLESRDRPIQAGDIMVLVRTRNEFLAALVRELKECDIAVAGVDRMKLGSQIAVMDLLVLAEFLLHAEDDLALATVLRSPLVGISDEALFDLAWRRTGSLWVALGARRDTRPEFATAYEWLAALRAETDYLPPFELFQRALGRRAGGAPTASGRRALTARLGYDAADPLDEFLALALAYDRQHAPSLQGFLAWFSATETEVKRDLDHGSRDQVRLMTVHGAKGLQAPIVYLPDTTSLPQDKERLLWIAEEPGANMPGGLIWAPRRDDEEELAGSLRAQFAASREAEYRRLLYVAMTRAEDRLYVGGWRDNDKRDMPDECWYRLVERGFPDTARFDFDNSALFDRPEEGWTGIGRRIREEPGAPPDRIQKATPPAPTAALPAWADTLPPPEARPGRPLAPSRPSAEPAARSPLAGDGGAMFRRGLVVHRLLELLPALPADARRAAGARLLADPRHALPAAAQRALLDETMAVLEAPDLAWIFGPGSLAEVPMIGAIDAADGTRIAVAGQIDRVAIADDRVAIVDYKTLRPVPPSVTEAPAPYLRQLAAYRALAASIWPGRRIECWLLWTEGPQLMEIPEKLLASPAP